MRDAPLNHLTKNGDGSYTLSKSLVHILIGVFLTVALGTIVSISAWWFGFAGWQANINRTASLVEKHEEWFRSGKPSPLAEQRLEDLQRELQEMAVNHKDFQHHLEKIDEEIRKHEQEDLRRFQLKEPWRAPRGA